MATPTPAPRGAALPPPAVRPGGAGPGWRIPAARTSPESLAGRPPLTDRDRELLRHLAAGRSTGQIAAAMSISTNTVRTRIRRVSAKLAVTERQGIVRTARGLGLA